MLYHAMHFELESFLRIEILENFRSIQLGEKVMKNVTDKIFFWIQILGLAGMVVILIVCFQGKEDETLEQLLKVGIAVTILVFSFSGILSSGRKEAGIQFCLFAAVCIGVGLFAISKGYGSGEAKDCGIYLFKAEKYWQEKHTIRVRGRITTDLVNYVRYEGILDNGEKVVYQYTVPSYGEAMELVKGKDATERQVFFCNGNYYTKEPGTSLADFIAEFMRWKKILFVAAGVYGTLGILLILFRKRD